MKLVSPSNISLEITGSSYAINYILSQPNQFYVNMLTNLKVTIVNGTTDLLQTSLYSNLVTLVIVSKCEKSLHNVPFSSHENNLCTLLLMWCHLSNECVSSLIHFLQSPNNRINTVILDRCTIQIHDHSNSAAISYRLELISPMDSGNFSLEITGSLYAINYILSQPNQFYANTLTSLKVTILNGTTTADSLQTSLYSNLVTLVIVSKCKENKCSLQLKREQSSHPFIDEVSPQQ